MAIFSTLSLDEARRAVLPPRRATQAQYQEYVRGLTDAAVQEARERVRAAIRNSGLSFPTRRITVNLAPEDVR